MRKRGQKSGILLVLLTAFLSIMLFSTADTGAEKKDPVIVETGGIASPSADVGKKLYMHYCIPCHGINGDGKGANAEYLDPKPANHTDSKEMSKRTDEKLYDTIDGGGKSVAKSTYMPPWGNTFNEKQIESLVLYLRKLCKCQGPAE